MLRVRIDSEAHLYGEIVSLTRERGRPSSEENSVYGRYDLRLVSRPPFWL